MQRVVLHHANGLRRIIGLFDPEEHRAEPIITFPDEAFDVGPHCVRAGLVAVTNKTITYREIV